jgi:hypothetical protein
MNTNAIPIRVKVKSQTFKDKINVPTIDNAMPESYWINFGLVKCGHNILYDGGPLNCWPFNGSVLEIDLQ